jgi:hypothetical protein
MISIGIDPGVGGGLAAISDPGQVSDCMKLKDATEADIADWFRWFEHESAAGIVGARAFVEKVSASPQMGTVSCFTFGRAYGFLRGLLIALQIPFEEVSPQRWQKDMQCLSGGDKNVTKARAQQLWPHEKITHANADALLIAEWGRRQLVLRTKGEVA